MNLAETIKQACAEMGVTQAELARRMNQSPQNLGKKLRNSTLNFEEFSEAMDVLGVRYEANIIYPTDENGREHQSLQEKLAYMQSQLETSRRYAQYLLSMSRDTRTALYTINGCADLALKHIDDSGRIKDCLEKIKDADAQITTLLNEVLDIDHAEDNYSKTRDDLATTRVNAQSINGRRVLLVDDNIMNLEITRDVLTDNDILVETATNGEDAVKKIENSSPGFFDCILMDILMPIMDGYEATKAIRNLPNRAQSNTPIIAMTANAFEEDRKKAFESGMDAYLTKPIDATKLLTTLARII